MIESGFRAWLWLISILLSLFFFLGLEYEDIGDGGEDFSVWGIERDEMNDDDGDLGLVMNDDDGDLGFNLMNGDDDER